jgi:PIN domain nuclease of toxin-antitoxin system
LTRLLLDTHAFLWWLACDEKLSLGTREAIGMPITIEHAQAAGALPGPHRDPFDRMLIAQALLNDLVLISNEGAFAYGVRRLW